MYRISNMIIGLALVLTLTLTRGGIAQQQHQQHHPGWTPASQEDPAATGPQEQEQAPMRQQMRHMMQQMQDMMQHMRGMMGQGMMIQRHHERVAQQLGLSDEQRTQAQTLLRNHAKEIIRLRAEIDTLAIDAQSLLEADPVDLPKVKQTLQAMATKEVDLRLVHITAMQDVRKLLTPEQQPKFRLLQRQMMMGDGGMMGAGGIIGHGGMMGRGSREQ